MILVSEPSLAAEAGADGAAPGSLCSLHDAGSEAVTETVDVWSFARDLNSADPTWLLVGTRSE